MSTRHPLRQKSKYLQLLQLFIELQQNQLLIVGFLFFLFRFLLSTWNQHLPCSFQWCFLLKRPSNQQLIVVFPFFLPIFLINLPCCNWRLLKMYSVDRQSTTLAKHNTPTPLRAVQHILRSSLKVPY